MKNNKVKTKYKSDSQLRFVGEWATIWWALSGIFLVILVAEIVEVYSVYQSQHFSNPSWWYALSHAFSDHINVGILFSIVLIGWVLCAVVWLRALRQAKISYKAGLKDLFFTIR